MDATHRKITKIAREIGKFTARTLKIDGVGTAEFDLIHLIRKNPGITQSGICRILGADKGAVAKQIANLEAKGYLRRKTNPADRRSRLLYATEKTDELKNSKSHLEELFYEWLLEPLAPAEQEELARLLAVLEPRCREEWRAGFPNVKERLAAEEAQKQGGEPA